MKSSMIGLRPLTAALLIATSPLWTVSVAWAASDYDEFRVKREAVFEFAEKPTVTREGDCVTIEFEAKGFCDVTVAIEDEDRQIVRHLASGVLGGNAPEPFQKNSKRQVIVWDGKDDQGVYIDERDSLWVRVSLGLKPRFERTLFWSPEKRISSIAPIMCAAPEGVYVFQGRGVDDLKFFDHDGTYVRTIYPFPANRIDEIVGLQHHTFPQDGQPLPLKLGYNQATLLSSGSSASPQDIGHHYGGYAATAMAVCQGRIALVSHYLNRLGTDGTSGGRPIKGPKTAFEHSLRRGQTAMVGPTSAAFSPDGQWLYMTGYVWKYHFHIDMSDAFHVVMRMAYDTEDTPAVFVGEVAAGEKYGSDNAHFCVPTSVDCDAKGRVYVSDYMNDRIQVFAPDGTYLKTIETVKPARVLIHPRTQEVWSFSWPTIGASRQVMRSRHFSWRDLTSTVTRLGTFEHPKPARPAPLPIGQGDAGGWTDTAGQVWQVAIDPWAEPTALWIVGRKPLFEAGELHWSGRRLDGTLHDPWTGRGIRLLVEKDGTWVTRRDFGELTRRAVKRTSPPDFARQRLYFNRKDGQLYVGEDMGFCKSFDQMPVIDPETGRIRLIDLPFDAEDLCFDLNGLAYLRTDTVVMRFNPETWREVPWDYGQMRERVYFQGFHAPRLWTPAAAALRIPGRRPTPWHMAGMAINAKGHLAVTCCIRTKKQERAAKERNPFAGALFGEAYTPQMYPGRAGPWVVNVYDQRGKLIHEDAVPGLLGGDGIGIDRDDNIYVLVSAPRVLDGNRYFDAFSETLMKFKPGRMKFLSSGRAPVPIPEADRPERHADVTRYGVGATWAEGADWKYGGVGYGGQGGSCVCWHARFVLDDLGRSFVPEVRRYNVAVLDSNGNLILRVGRYGNVEDGKPLVARGGPGNPRSLGGDEVALVHCAYVGVDTDRRLFLSDPGNGRILSVKLDYHTEERVAL